MGIWTTLLDAKFNEGANCQIAQIYMLEAAGHAIVHANSQLRVERGPGMIYSKKNKHRYYARH